MYNQCDKHNTLMCQLCSRDSRAPLNEFRHRMKRREIGLTSCVACNDTGFVSFNAGGPGMHGLYESHECRVCRCHCGEPADYVNGSCEPCWDKLQAELDKDPNFKINLKKLFGG